MKFLLDSCISSFAIKDLRDAGFDALWIPEIGKDPGDDAIIKKAFDEGLINASSLRLQLHASPPKADKGMQIFRYAQELLMPEASSCLRSSKLVFSLARYEC